MTRTPSPARFGRRLLLKAAAAALVLCSLPGRALALVVERFPTRTVERHAFSFAPHSGSVVWDDGREEPYSLVLEGLVREPAALSYADLRALPQTRQVSDFHCVEGWSLHDVPWAGVRFDDLFALVRPDPAATHVAFHALGATRQKAGGLDHYVESLALADLVDPERDYLLALDLDGAPLPDDRGAPARVVCPRDLAYKSIKFVTRIRFTDRPVPGWWTRANPVYPWKAPVPAHRLRNG
jgi:DMSO/TMAO reductase YedYZ molybdopterin-dependent catalytic subunit